MFKIVVSRAMAAAMIAACSVAIFAAPATAGNTVLFSPSIGDITFPFTAPKPSTGAPGLIDNMTIGATTPQAGSFTALKASSITNTGPAFGTQGAPVAATVSATLTAANLQAGIITVLQGAGAASAQQLPLASAMDTAFPSAVAGTALDFSVINISATAAEAASITTNTGWTLVGDMDIQANNAATTKSAGRFKARKTGTGAWTLYRLS